jgi:lipopolysaccharide transport system permease protein
MPAPSFNVIDVRKTVAKNGKPPSAADAEAPFTIVRSAKGAEIFGFRELWKFRELIGFLTWRDVKVRYKQTMLGAAWAILQPALMMVVFSLFLGRLAGISSSDIPYPVFVYAGLLPWMFFANAVTNAGNSVVGAERLITKIYFPRLAIPFAAVFAAVVDFACGLSLLVVLLPWAGRVPGPGLFAAPLIFGLIVLTAVGVGSLLAALNVAYRDFRYVIPFLIQVWMFATPTIYLESAENSTGYLQTLLAFNPMAGLVSALRAALLGGSVPWGQVALAACWAIPIFLLGCGYFRTVEDSFADVI